MVNVNNISKYVLEQLKGGNINKETAIEIVKKLNEKEDIAIIGMACKNGSITDYEEFWKIQSERRTNVGRSKGKRNKLVEGYYEKKFGKTSPNKGSYFDDIEMFDPDFFEFSPKEACFIHPGLRKALEVSYRALEDAGYLGERLVNNKMGLYLGNNFVTDSMMSYADLCLRSGRVEDGFQTLLYNWTSGLATRITNFFNLKGASYVVDGSCASSTIAIHNAMDALLKGECTTAIAGGMLFDIGMHRKRESRLQWAFFHDDSVIVRMFDNNCGGAYMAEGMAFLVLKPLKKAVEDKDRIHGIISSCSLNNNGANADYVTTSAEDIKKSVAESIKASRVDPENIRFLLTEGYAQKLVEGFELQGIIDGFKMYTARKQFCALGSITPNIGYMQSCIGVFNILYATMALKKKKIPPLYHFIQPTDTVNFCDSPLYPNDVLLDWECEEGKERCAGVNSYGFGGINLFLVIREACEQMKSSACLDENLFLLTAKSEYSFKSNLEKYIGFLKKTDSSLTDICGNAATRRILHKEYRLAIVAKSKEELLEKLETFHFEAEPDRRIYFSHESISASKKNKKARLQDIGEYSADELGRNFADGKNYLFTQMYRKEDIGFVPLPSYEFDRHEYWCYNLTKKEMTKLYFQNLGNFLKRKEE